MCVSIKIYLPPTVFSQNFSVGRKIYFWILFALRGSFCFIHAHILFKNSCRVLSILYSFFNDCISS